MKNKFFRILTVFFIFIILTPEMAAQQIILRHNNEPLNKILISLRDDYGMMFSFDDKELSHYRVTIDKTFGSATQAIDFLIKGFPLTYDFSNGVFIIYKKEIIIEPMFYNISGTVVDKTSLETLPFSSVLVNNSGVITDARGFFSTTSSTDSLFRLQISYLGYYILDTIVPAGLNYRFRLIPSVIALKEIIVEGRLIARSIQTGISPGTSKLNHKIAYFLPGNGDNSIYNLLRLQPGIVAAGEQTSDLIVWGSYEGHSQVIFDGFTLFGMKNFNDNIGAVNPFMAKDIKVMKGGYDAGYGERVGAIVDITGTDGNRLSPSARLTINNMTLNSMASVPFRNKSSLMLAYRQTYYELYDPITLSGAGTGRGKYSGGADYYITPDYGFRDLNLKYSGAGDRSNYFFSLYGGLDKFSMDFNQENIQRTITLNYNEENLQLGGTAFYNLRWNNKNSGSIAVSYSSLQTERDNLQITERRAGNQNTTNINEQYNNEINEVNSRVENKTVLSQKHTLHTGAGLLYYTTLMQQGTVQQITSEDNYSMQVPYLFVLDNFSLSERITIKPGFRTDYHFTQNRVFFQPRLSIACKLSNDIKFNTAAGLYNQFTAKNMYLDTLKNVRLHWALCDIKTIPVLSATHYTAGFSLTRKNFTATIEGYLKYTGGIVRFIQDDSEMRMYEGDARTKGLDFFVKQEFKNQSVWVAYTLSKTEEYFPYFPGNDYLPAMHDQRHELKLAGLFKFRSLHFSASYIYGSGFPDPAKLPSETDYTYPYSRLDASLIYRFLSRKVHLDAGISVLNILNRENIKYSNLTRIVTDETTPVSLYSEAVPFTPALFLNVYF
ncbi:MAG: TonB-dependent receptor [Bacteroidales bacterium]|nr:TonB-dependent receptor [Bacteroidales bacterium]